MTTASLFRARTPSRRWFTLVIIVLLLHVLMIDWAGDGWYRPALPDRPHPVITAQLHTFVPAALPVPAAAPAVEAAPLPPVRPAIPKKNTRAAVPPPPASAPPLAADEAIAMEAPGPSVKSVTAVETAEVSAAPANAPPASDTLQSGAGTQASPVAAADPELQAIAKPVLPYKVAPPPSAELNYDVQALRAGQTIHGSGKISWQYEGALFKVHGEAGVLFFNVLDFTSEGVIDRFGIAPVLYSEKRFRKSATNTHFHRERNTISFSASTTTYPRTGGEQDRASIIWQMAGIGRADSEQFYPGAQINIMVAGARDAEVWQLRVIGREDVQLGSSQASAWHVVRSPRPGSYEQRIDIWLAPDQQWYPVKLRFTEVNGDYLDLSLSTLHTAAQP